VLATLLEHRTKADNAVKYLVKQRIGMYFACLKPLPMASGKQPTMA